MNSLPSHRQSKIPYRIKHLAKIMNSPLYTTLLHTHPIISEKSATEEASFCISRSENILTTSIDITYGITYHVSGGYYECDKSD